MIPIEVRVLGKEIIDNHHITLKYDKLEPNKQGEVDISLTFDETLSKYDLNKEDIYGIWVDMPGGNNGIFHVQDFDYFCITNRRTSTPLSFDIVTIVGIGDHGVINNLNCGRMDIEESRVRINNSNIESLNFGLGTMLGKKEEDINEEQYDLTINNSRIDELAIYSSCSSVNLEKVTISNFQIRNYKARINHLLQLKESNIDRFNSLSDIGDISLHRSNISEFLIGNNVKIKRWSMDYSTIVNTYNLNLESFENNRLETYQLIMKSAKNNIDDELYATAGYQYMREKTKHIKGWIPKNVHRLMGLTTGYGYRPLNTVFSAIFIWFVFGVLYTLIDLSHIYDSLNLIKTDTILSTISKNLYFSIITFTTTGYGDILPIYSITKILAGIESMLGIVLMALFIFSLTKRYGSTD